MTRSAESTRGTWVAWLWRVSRFTQGCRIAAEWVESALQVTKCGASGEIRTLNHLFLRQAAIPIRTRWHSGARGGFEPPRPTREDRVTAGPFRPGSRTCANLAEGRRIERPSLITMPRFSGPVAGHSAVPSAWRRVRELNPLASCESPCLADKCLTVRPTLRQNCQRTKKFW